MRFEESEDAAIAAASELTGLPAEEIVRALTMSGLLGTGHPAALPFWRAASSLKLDEME